MSNQILKTGWKHWDMYLSKFVGKKINCLDIGSYQGASTCWMLNNLCTNPYSRVFSVDTWEGSPEYGNYTNEIEKKFDEEVEKTGKKDQHVKMKMTSNKALLKLIEFKYIIFDIIFIDASHEAKDVITDAILSWDILNEQGILIFDDYKWNILKGEEFRPKLAIDSFVAMFKPQLKTLYSGYQYIIEKINERDYSKPELTDYYKLIEEINKYKINKLEIIFDDIVYEEFEFKLGNIINNKEINQVINNISNLNKEISITSKNTKELWMNTDKYNTYIKNIDSAYSLIKNTVYEKNLDYKFLLRILYSIEFIFNMISLKNNDNIFVIDRYIDNNFINVVYDIYKFNKKLKININNILITQQIKDELINKNKKYEYIYIGINEEKQYDLLLLFKILVSLNIQQINGKLMIVTPFTVNLYTLSEFIYILKKYYKEIKFYKKYAQYYGKYNIIECINYIGINNIDLNKINNILTNIFNNNSTYNSILNINNNTLYINITHKLLNYTNNFNTQLHDKILLLNKISTFIINNKHDKDKILDRFNNKILLNLFKILYIYYKKI